MLRKEFKDFFFSTFDCFARSCDKITQRFAGADATSVTVLVQRIGTSDSAILVAILSVLGSVNEQKCLGAAPKIHRPFQPALLVKQSRVS